MRVVAASGGLLEPSRPARSPQELTDAFLVLALDALDAAVSAAASDGKATSGRAQRRMWAALVAADMGGHVLEDADMLTIGTRLQRQAVAARAITIDGEREARVAARAAAEGDPILAASLPGLLAASEAAEAAEFSRLGTGNEHVYIGFHELVLLDVEQEPSVGSTLPAEEHEWEGATTVG